MNRLNEVLETLKVTDVFLTGGAGVGKTTLTNAVIQEYEKSSKKVAKLASTGMAATLLGGQTLHSFFDFGIAGCIEELERNKKLSIPAKVKRILQKIDLVVIDEISMVSHELMDMVRLRLLQADYKGRVLVVGDFLQLPPITRSQIRFAFESEAWRRFGFRNIVLDRVYRTDDAQFIELLHRVRFGDVRDDVQKALCAFIRPLPEDLREFTFLFGKNDSVTRHNQRQLAYIDSEEFVKEASVEVYDAKVQERDVERFFADARIERRLVLKRGAPVLFTRNAWNYYNGERGTVVDVDDEAVYVRKSDGITIKLTPQKQSKTRWVEKSKDGTKEAVEEELFSVYQYPIRLAFAITIHKSQGMSIEDLIIESNEIFAPSQFYVALSRAKNPARLSLTAPKRGWNSLIYVNSKAVDFYRNMEEREK